MINQEAQQALQEVRQFEMRIAKAHERVGQVNSTILAYIHNQAKKVARLLTQNSALHSNSHFAAERIREAERRGEAPTVFPGMLSLNGSSEYTNPEILANELRKVVEIAECMPTDLQNKEQETLSNNTPSHLYPFLSSLRDYV